MRARAFTLVEIMVVVLIVTAISALVLPSLVARAAGSKMDGAVRAIEFGAALAASEAMRRGEMVVCVAERDGEEWVLYAESIEPERVGGVFVRDPRELSSEDAPEPPDPDSPRWARWTRVELASFTDVEIRREPVMAAVPGADAGELPDEELFPIEDEDEFGAEFGLGAGVNELPERWVFGVFFADGSARPGPTLYLLAEKGRDQRSVTLRPLTGGAVVERVDPFGDMPIEEDGGGAAEDEAMPMPPPATSTADSGPGGAP